MIPFCCCCNYAVVGYIGMQIFNFVVVSVITTPHNVPTPHISKTICLLFHLLYLNSNRIDAQKTSQEKKGGSHVWG